MHVSLRHLFGWIVSAFGSREDLILENLALRQQLLALHAPTHPHSSFHHVQLRWLRNENAVQLAADGKTAAVR